jgi:GT2 family glycosyltransferase
MPLVTTPGADVDLTIIVVSYNTREMTLACIASVLDQTHDVDYALAVLDNASADGSAEAIAEQFPQVSLIASPTNHGFGKGNNIAAQSANGRRILLLNPDTVVLDRGIDRLWAFAQAHPDRRIWGGRTLYADGRLNPGSCWGRASLWSLFCMTTGLTGFRDSPLFNPEGYGGWRRDSERIVDIVTGCFLLIDADLWRHLAGFDPVFFMYAEEADLCLRARALGARPTITPSATIIHHGAASEPRRADQRIKVFAGRLTLLRRHRGPAANWIARRLYLLATLARAGAYGVAGRLRPSLAQNAQAWRQVWRERALWIDGWSESGVAWARKQGGRSAAPARS